MATITKSELIQQLINKETDAKKKESLQVQLKQEQEKEQKQKERRTVATKH